MNFKQNAFLFDDYGAQLLLSTLYKSLLFACCVIFNVIRHQK